MSNDVKDAIKRSVQSTPSGDGFQFAYNNQWVLNLATVADGFTQWGQGVRQRDIELRNFYPTEPILAGAVAKVSARNAAQTFKFDGPPRTVKAVQEMWNRGNNGKGAQHLLMQISQDLYCLAGVSTVALGGDRLGKRKRIRDIVNEKDTGPVLTIEPDGTISERMVNQWHKSPLGNRRWRWLSIDKANSHSQTADGGLFLTEDHPVLTSDGWIPAGAVEVGMMVATSHAVPNTKQMEMITGTMLGDGYMKRTAKSSRLSLSHCVAQKEWLRLKSDSLKGFAWTRWETNKQVGARTMGTVGLNECQARWYSAGKKRIDRQAVAEYFSPLLLAVWYGDDGSIHKSDAGRPSAFISTQGFDDDDVMWLCELLQAHGYNAQARLVKWKKGKQKGLRIYIGAESSSKMFEAIGAYFPPTMRYKLPPDAPQFDGTLWDLGRASPFMDKVLRAEWRDYYSGYDVCKTTYHIGVEGTRNFIANCIVVHNTQDNGAFIEIIREQDKENSPVVMLAHRDPAQCIRTGNYETPVKYVDPRNGSQHLLKYYQVITLEEMPSSIETMNNVQYCALTRIFRAAQIMRDLNILDAEKVGGRFTRRIILTSGVSQSLIDDSQTKAQNRANNEGLLRYIQPVILASLDPTATIAKTEIDLANVPDGLDRQQAFQQYIATLALGFLEDYQMFAPLPAGNLGTSTQSEVLARKSRGTGPALFNKLFLHELTNSGIFPDSVEVSIEEKDTKAEQDDANVKQTRAATRAARIASQEITPAVARQIAVDDGDLDPEYLHVMGEDDVTEDITITDDESAEIETGEGVNPVAAMQANALPQQQPQQPAPIAKGLRAQIDATLKRVNVALKELTRRA